MTADATLFQEAVLERLEQDQLLGEAEAEMLITAALGPGKTELLGKLWSILGQISEGAKSRLMAPEALLAAFPLVPIKVAGAVAGLEGRQRGALLQRMVEDLHKLGSERSGERAAEAVLGAALGEPLCMKPTLEILRKMPNLIDNAALYQSASAVAIARQVVDGVLTGEWDAGATMPPLVRLLSRVYESSGAEELNALRQDCMGVLRRLAEGELFCRVVAKMGSASVLSEAVVNSVADADELISQVLSAALSRRGAQPKGLISSMVASRVERVADTTCMLLPWKALDELQLENSTKLEMRTRAFALAAVALAGNIAAQETFWGLADEWDGNMADLVTAASRVTKHR